MGKAGDPGPGRTGTGERIADKFEDMAGAEPAARQHRCDDADVVVVSFGTSGPFVEEVVDELRAEGSGSGRSDRSRCGRSPTPPWPTRARPPPGCWCSRSTPAR